MARVARKIHLEIEGEETSYRIESDRLGYNITYYAETRKNDGSKGQTWYALPASNYGTFTGVCQRLLKELIREVDAEDIKALIAAVDAAGKRIADAVRELDGPQVRGEGESE